MGLRTVVKKFIPTQLFPKIEPYGHLAEAVLFNTLNGFPARNLKIIGVTGTNGKTTTSFLIHRMLHDAGYKVGLMTTVAYGAGDNIKPQMEHMTSVPVPQLMKRLKWMKSQGVEWLVLETTSQALAQNRVWGVPYSLAVMTNITHEHLDYHKTFENYRDAKKKLFVLTNKNKKGLRGGVINADDPSADLFVAAIRNPLTYGIKKGELRAENIKLTASGSTFDACIGDTRSKIICHLPGSFNIYNSLAAVAAGQFAGLKQEEIEKGIAALKSVEGRMNTVDEGQDYEVIVDYAHTPDSFEKLFKDIKPVVKGKLIILFGSAGRRDEAKRPIQGELAGKYGNEVIITEEDDRDKDGNQIMDEIAAGAEKAGKKRGTNLFLELDRTKAIQLAISHAEKGDTVLLLGKGHEKTIERADGEHPWDEIGATQKILKDSLKK
jgi:UDP-N-acetylmuramoyl-L-alanyl-D-glutamate--2,6-diaminopimelate ligase